MATYYDGLNDFHMLNETTPLQSSAQLVYLHLLHLNNRAGNAGTLQISDRELELRTSLSKKSITFAKRTLKNLGLIDFRHDRGAITTYELKFFEVGHQVGQMLRHKVGHSSREAPLSHLTNEEKKEEKEARAREGGEGNGYRYKMPDTSRDGEWERYL